MFYFQIFLIIVLIHITASSGKDFDPDRTENSSIQKIQKEDIHIEVNTENSVIEKIPAPNHNKNRVRRQIITQRRNSIFGRRGGLRNYPALSGFINQNDRFPTVA